MTAAADARSFWSTLKSGKRMLAQQKTAPDQKSDAVFLSR